MQSPTDWAWEVPLGTPTEPASQTRLVLLALAGLSSPTFPGSPVVRLGVIDPQHPAIAARTGLSGCQVARHVTALTRAGVLIPAPAPHSLVRLNEDITATSSGIAQTVADTLSALTALPDNVIGFPAPRASPGSESEQAPLIDVPDTREQPATTGKTTRKTKSAATDSPEEAAAKAVLSWWWEHWTSTVGPVANGAAFSAHCKRITKTMLAEGYGVDAIKAAFVDVDQPKPAEFAIRNHLRGKGSGAKSTLPAALGATQQHETSMPFTMTGGRS